MKILAIDTAVSKITIACKSDDKTVTEVFDIGMKQSETLLPAIIDVLNKLNVTPADLDCLAITKGPGSFTGLRLGFACLKALEMVSEKPLYGFSTLDVYASPFNNIPFMVLSLIDAHKEKYYFKAFNNGKEILEEGDYDLSFIMNFLEKNSKETKVFVTGPDSESFINVLKENNFSIENLYSLPFSTNPTDALIKMAENAFENKKSGLQDYDGPVYLRASEAEENLSK